VVVGDDCKDGFGDSREDGKEREDKYVAAARYDSLTKSIKLGLTRIQDDRKTYQENLAPHVGSALEITS
jgi:hypothetical protein